MTLTSTQLGQLAAQFFLAGAGTLSVAVLFACPKRTLPYCALVGAVGWFVYELAVLYGADAAAASLIAIIPLSLAARICAVLLKTPVPVFLLTGIFPLLFVPAAAGVMELGSQLMNLLLPAVLAIVPITALVMAVTGMVAQKCAGGKEHKNG